MTAHAQDTYRQDCTIFEQINRPPTLPVVIGVDEVGRGSLFGQLTVGAVILPSQLSGDFGQVDLTNSPLATINDSKKLSEKKRTALFDPIATTCQSYALVDVPAYVIDKIDIFQATLLGMRLAIEALIVQNALSPAVVQVLIDGNAVPALSADFADFQPCLSTIIKGDGKHTAIACASILAKVHRDGAMDDFAKRYPQYGLDKHKGYASKAHTTAIYEHGILPEHRKSFNPMRTLLLQEYGQEYGMV